MADKHMPAVDFIAIESVLDTLLRSESASEFCRALVHSDFSASKVMGCHLYALDNRSQLGIVAGYGLALDDFNSEVSAWDENPIALSVRSKTYVFVSSDSSSHAPLLAIPLLRENVPLGCLSLVLVDSVAQLPMHEKMIPIIGKLGAYCLTTVSRTVGKSAAREATGEDLTGRQIKILDFMAEGMVNAEIANRLLVSESTVRQETVRIYRALGVPNRSEAAKKGRALGLIRRSPLV